MGRFYIIFTKKINKSVSILLMSQNLRCPLAAAVWHRQSSSTLLPLSINGTDRQAGRRQTVTIPFHRHSPLEMGSVKNTIALLLFH